MKMLKIISKSKTQITIFSVCAFALMFAGCAPKQTQCLQKYNIAINECEIQTKPYKDELKKREAYNKCMSARGYVAGVDDCGR